MIVAVIPARSNDCEPDEIAACVEIARATKVETTWVLTDDIDRIDKIPFVGPNDPTTRVLMAEVETSVQDMLDQALGVIERSGRTPTHMIVIHPCRLAGK